MPPRTQGSAGRVQGHRPGTRSSTPIQRRLSRSTSLLPRTFGVLSIPSRHQHASPSSTRIAVAQSVQRHDLTKQLNELIYVAADKLRDPVNVAGKRIFLRVRHSAESEVIPTVGAALEP